MCEVKLEIEPFSPTLLNPIPQSIAVYFLFIYFFHSSLVTRRAGHSLQMATMP